MLIPTMRVVLKASGDEILINACDFDEALYAPIEDASKAPENEPEPEAEPVPEPEDIEPEGEDEDEDEEVEEEGETQSINEISAKDAIEEIRKLDNIKDLKAALEDENDGTPRKTVVAAIEKRIAELKE